MTIGALGELAFLTSPEKIRTPRTMDWSGSARWAVHERHMGDALTEFTGRGADKISMEIYLSRYLGVEPMKDIETIWKYEREGIPVPLVIGTHRYGKYRWVVESHKVMPESTDAAGDLLTCTVQIDLLEYLRV